MSKSMNSKLDSFRALIFNCRDEEIAPELATQGVEAEFLDEGEGLYNEVMRLMEVQKKEYQEEREAYDIYFAKKDDVEQAFQNTRDLVRELSNNDPDLQNRLKFSPMSRLPLGDWIQAGIDFYDSLFRESALLQRLARFNVFVERLSNEKRVLEVLRPQRSRAMMGNGHALCISHLRHLTPEGLRH